MKKIFVLFNILILLSLTSCIEGGFKITNNNKIESRSAEVKINRKDNINTEETSESKQEIIQTDADVEFNTSVILGYGINGFDKAMQNKVYADREKRKWVYGKMPVAWIFVEPNKQIVSNYKPNGSKNFAIPLVANSGKKGCFVPVFSGTENYNEFYEGRIYIFEDSKRDPRNFTFTNSLKDVDYKGINVEDILKRKYKFNKLENGLLETNKGIINIIYADVLENIISEYAVG